MFDGFLKSKFFKNCKLTLKMTKVRIDGIQRKRIAMQKYLKNDISDLLTNGYHLNAYGRAEGLIVEMNKSVFYDLIEQFCTVISEHLSVMSKQKECPEECKEAVSSLMFAAARFADLPELRELRTIFSDRYGNSIDIHVSQEFVEKLKVSTPTKDMKLQLLQDIATEYGVEWDPKNLENQLYKPPPIVEQVRSKNTDQSERETKKIRYRPVRDTDKQNVTPKTNEKHEVLSSGKTERSDEDKYESRDIEINGNIEATNKDFDKEKVGDKKSVSYKSIPPPYTKLNFNDSKNSSSLDESDDQATPKPKSVRRRHLNPRTQDAGLKLVIENNVEDKKGNKNSSHSRTLSLPEEISPTETKRGHTRAFSFQPDIEHTTHPKLLDYDDFVARLAALRQN